MLSLLQPLREIPLAFVDTETTGVSVDFGHRVLEVGIVRVEGGRIVAEYQQLINPNRRIGPGVSALTGISKAMVELQPSFLDQLPSMMHMLSGAIVVGHNVRFDLSFLGSEIRRCGTEMAELLNHCHVMDTVRMARRRFGRGGNGLQILAPRLGIKPVDAHRALADARTTALIFEKLIESIGRWDAALADVLMAQGGPMSLAPAPARQSLLPLELEEALEMRKAVMMEYLDARQQRTRRVVMPLEVRRYNGELVLIAHCELRQAQRTFKVERIVQLTRIDASAPAATSENDPA